VQVNVRPILAAALVLAISIALVIYIILNDNADTSATEPDLSFYSQWDRSGDIPIAASSNVDANALLAARIVVDNFLIKLRCRPDILDKFLRSDIQIRIIGRSEHITDLPEFKAWKIRRTREAIDSTKSIAAMGEEFFAPQTDLRMAQISSLLYLDLGYLLASNGLVNSD
jgi:hypothetical protein